MSTPLPEPIEVGVDPQPAFGVTRLGPPRSVGAADSLLELGASPRIARPSRISPLAPPLVEEKPLRRRSWIYDLPVLVQPGEVDPDWSPTSLVESEWGVLRVLSRGRDVTIFRGAPVLVERWTDAEPFGPGPAVLVIPKVAPGETLGGSALSWIGFGDPIEIVGRRSDGTRRLLWNGFVGSHEPDYNQASAEMRVVLTGLLWQGDLTRMRGSLSIDHVDVGIAVTQALNAVPSRRFPLIPVFAIGIASNQRGSYEQSPIGYAQELLSTATQPSGERQYTIGPTVEGGFELRLKDNVNERWTVVAGQPGVDLQLTRSIDDGPNAIYGTGVEDNGGRWANWRYPGLHRDTAPAYPNSSASNTITVGETDASTSSGSGVSTWERRMRQLGYSVVVDGRYSSADAAQCRSLQAARGIQVDAIIGPQTWAATFEVGSNVGELDSAYRAPLAVRPEVEPLLYHPDGSPAGPNPAFDPSVMRVEREISFGAGVSKAEGVRSAQQMLAREHVPGWVGTITLAADPQESSRLEIRAGHNIRPRGFHSESGPLLHIAQVEHVPGGVSTLTVDEKARDLLTVGQVIARNKQNLMDPARRPGPVTRRSRLQVDQVVEFDFDSAAGQVPRHAIFGGLWNVLRIPISQQGRISLIDYRTSGPARPFCLALFAAPITAAQLRRYVGNPIGEDSGSGYRPFDDPGGVLDEQFGFIEAFGGPGQPAGYYPGSAGRETPVTGRLYETASLEYYSARPPWIWLAEYAAGSCFAEGRLYPAPVI